MRPEEVGEWWMPRRKGFNVHKWSANCKCKCGHREHNPVTRRCNQCGCGGFQSAYRCVACDQSQEEHETVFETEDERRRDGRPCGADFFPLAANPAIQEAVFGTDAIGVARSPMDHGSEGDMLQAYQRGLKPENPMDKPERSVRLMHSSRGGRAEGARLNRWGKVGTAEEAIAEEERTGFARLPSCNSPSHTGSAAAEDAIITPGIGYSHDEEQFQGTYYTQQIVAFYEDNNPEKITDGTLDRLLEKYQGKEHLLLKKLHEKYSTRS